MGSAGAAVQQKAARFSHLGSSPTRLIPLGMCDSLITGFNQNNMSSSPDNQAQQGNVPGALESQAMGYLTQTRPARRGGETMPKTYQNPVYPYVPPPELESGFGHHPVVIAGSGPTGLAAAVDLARQGVHTVVLDDNNTVSVGSRAICFAKRTLEYMDRLGCGEAMLNKGLTWQVGKVFLGEHQVHEFNLLPEEGHHMPAFINLQQYYCEEYLVNRAHELSEFIDLRWKNKVTAVESRADGAVLSVETPDGRYRLRCDYLVAADGANSGIREMLQLGCSGQVFDDRFLIADVVMKADFPTERWFWFDPPFHPNQSVLLHKEPDDVWRIDFQLGADADPQEENQEENVRARVRAMLGEDAEFELEWSSVYTFRCRKMDRFIHNRVVFIGDATCQVSPFGARGANGGLHGVENLCWKLGRVLRGEAPSRLLESYDAERQHGAAENIENSSRATDFITPKTPAIRAFRDAALELSGKYPFARSLVNSGRLSRPCVYEESPLNAVDQDDFPPLLRPGSPPQDAPLATGGATNWWLHLIGDRFHVLVDGRVSERDAAGLRRELDRLLQHVPDLVIYLVGPIPNGLEGLPYTIVVEDLQGYVGMRYDLEPGTTYVFRPDQHVAGRWRALRTENVVGVINRALGHSETAEEGVQHVGA